jgi:signal transduction histidine kinase
VSSQADKARVVRDAVEALEYLNLGLYTVVAVASVWVWRAHRERAGLWAAAAFVVLAAVIDAGGLLPDEANERWEEIALRAVLAALVLFPYLLYRFAIVFSPPGRKLSLLVGALTVVMVAWTFALPDVPAEGESWPWSFALYVGAFTLHWTLLTIVVTWRLWRAGRDEASVARRRMRLLAVAAALITLALLVAVSSPDEGSAADLVGSVLSSLSALLFLVGLAPPPLLRLAWRRPETARAQEAIAELMGATTERDVAERVLQPMRDIVGAHGIEIHDDQGELVGAQGLRSEGDGRIVEIALPGGRVTVWTSAYAPFFGPDELATLRTIGALTMLALDRARLFGQERDARAQLERADEVKTNFIALAAHELRTPVATVHGLVETIHGRRGQLDAEQVEELENVLRGQTARMKSLVEQLLDLSRLDAEAVTIQPVALAVRPRVQEIVAAAAGAEAQGIRIDVDPHLVAQVDPDALDRILSNLVVNALRYGETPVVVSAEQNDRHFRLTVEDSGEGVSPDFVPDLFERFSRSRGSETRTGTGLGLAIARSYAQAHRGELVYERAAPGGARFQLVLPVRPPG